MIPGILTPDVKVLILRNPLTLITDPANTRFLNPEKRSTGSLAPDPGILIQHSFCSLITDPANTIPRMVFAGP